MSLASVRAALETALATITPEVATKYENAPFEVPALPAPYQAAFLIPASPDNIEIGPGFTERGLFQVSLFYPLNIGSEDAQAQAKRIRDLFPFRASFVSGGVTVNITQTPEVGSGRPDGIVGSCP